MKLALYLTLLFTNKPIVTNHRDLILVRNNKELKQELEFISIKSIYKQLKLK